MNRVPPAPRVLGLAGLMPQCACLAVLVAGPASWRFAALALAWGYAALIFSFLGGLWWGLAAAAQAQGRTVPGAVWVAAVAPSLLALASYAPWVFGAAWPQPGLAVLGAALLASPLVDRALGALAPPWWMALRLPLSLGLGGATLATALV